MKSERKNLIQALTSATMSAFVTTEEMEKAHQLMNLMADNDAPKKRTRKSKVSKTDTTND